MSEPEKIKYRCIYCGNIVDSGSIMPSIDYDDGCKSPNAINKKHLWELIEQSNI